MLTSIDTSHEVGGKGDGLLLAKALGLRIPETFVISSDAAKEPTDELLAQVGAKVGYPCIFRSSANLEDNASKGGFYGTFVSAVATESSQSKSAIKSVVNSLRSPAANELTKLLKTSPTSMIVLVQPLIQGQLFGVFCRGQNDYLSVSELRTAAVQGQAPFKGIGSYSNEPFYHDLVGSVSVVGQIYANFEMEWAYADGTIYVLQLREIVMKSSKPHVVTNSDLLGYSVGDGIVSGPAHLLSDGDPPEGCVLIVSEPSEEHLKYLSSVKAVVCDHGTITSHLALLIREFDVIGLFGTAEATQLIKSGDIVTVTTSDLGVGFLIKGVLHGKYEGQYEANH